MGGQHAKKAPQKRAQKGDLSLSHLHPLHPDAMAGTPPASPSTSRHVGVDVRPLPDRARDCALAAGGVGAVWGATVAAAEGGAIPHGAAWVGSRWAAAAAAFIGLRHLILQGDWRNDREAVSAVAAAAVGGGAAALQRAWRRLRIVSAVSFVTGFGGHYLHRWWLRARLDWIEGETAATAATATTRLMQDRLRHEPRNYELRLAAAAK